MTPDPVCLNGRASLDEAAQIMTAARLKRLPVVYDQGRLTGIVSGSDNFHNLTNEANLRNDPSQPMTVDACVKILKHT